MEISNVDQEEANEDTTAMSILEDVEQDIESWVELRRQTVAELREIADYIESVAKDCGIAKVRNILLSIVCCYFSVIRLFS